MKKIKRIVTDKISKEFRIGFKKKQTALARIVFLFSGKEPKKILKVLKEVSFSVWAGEIVGVIGKNGSGKSTLLRILANIYSSYEGRKIINGKIIPLIGLGQGLKKRLTMTENIFLIGSLFGLSQKQIKKRFSYVVEFAELENFVNTKVYQFSTGMKQRLAFSIAINCNPDILLLDEVFAVGDQEFRLKSANKIKELVKRGTAAIFVSHELWMIERYCDRVIWLDEGKILKEGKVKKILKEYIKCSKD